MNAITVKSTIQMMMFGFMTSGVTYLYMDFHRPEAIACALSNTNLSAQSITSNSPISAQKTNNIAPIVDTTHRVVTKKIKESASMDNRPDDKKDGFHNDVSAAVASSERVREFSHYLQVLAEKDSSLLQDMEKKFTEEPINTEWSDTHAEKLQLLFRTDTSLSRIYPETIQCKSDRCKISIPVSSTDEANTISETFMKALNDKHSSINNSVVITTQDDAKAMMNLYVARNAEINLFQ
jgi:hypothetical protein